MNFDIYFFVSVAKKHPYSEYMYSVLLLRRFNFLSYSFPDILSIYKASEIDLNRFSPES